MDAGIGFQLTPQTKLNTGIYNLADEDIFYEEYGYVEDGRRYWLGVVTNF